jgi:hypothetical protein
VKISELISILESAKAAKGDLTVVVEHADWDVDLREATIGEISTTEDAPGFTKEFFKADESKVTSGEFFVIRAQ